MTIQTLYPDIKPTLNLDFANTEKLDPRITFTRASSARYYDGKTVAKAEENLLLQSQAMSVSPWVNAASGTASVVANTANAGVAPDGTSTASRWGIQLNGGTATGDIASVRQIFTPTAGLSYTYSVWIKSFDGTSTYNAQIIGADGAGSAVAITGTWTRFTVTATGVAAQIAFGVRLRGGQSPTNSDSADILVWGAQLEQRSAVTAYTATTTQPITNYIPVLLTATDNVARFDHNPTTSESLGLLVEEQRTNLVTYSEDFANAAWTKFATSITANTVVAPDGALTGDKLVEDTATSAHEINQAATLIIGTTYALSVFAKAAERTLFRIAGRTFANWSVFPSAVFNLSNGTVTSISGVGTPTITAVGNGWYRCTVFGTTSATAAGMTIGLVSTGTTSNYTGDGYSGVFLWGAQLEVGAFPTSYIPTVASQVTRSSDAASMTGANFSSWYSQGEGTLYVDVKRQALIGTSNFANIVNISDNTSANSLGFYNTGSTQAIDASSNVNNVSQYFFGTGSIVVNTDYKLCLAYKTNDIALSRNAGSVFTDTVALLPLVDRLYIGAGATGGGQWNGTIKKLSFYPKRLLQNSNVQALTA